MGSCFLSFLETQSKLLTSVSEIMTPLGAYKELGKGLIDSLSNSMVKDATVGWLAAAQVSMGVRWGGREGERGDGGKKKERGGSGGGGGQSEGEKEGEGGREEGRERERKTERERERERMEM